jgi:hypothetical protein
MLHSLDFNMVVQKADRNAYQHYRDAGDYASAQNP